MNGPLEKEVERIRDEYRRRGRDLPKDFYRSAGDRFLHRERKHAAAAFFRRERLPFSKDMKILEVGCGNGAWFADLRDSGAEEKALYGLDLDPARILNARRQFPEAHVLIGEASHLPWPDRVFDMAVQSTLLTSVLEPMLKKKITAEMARVLKPGGVILWYDFFYDNPANRQVKGIRLDEIKKLFPDSEIHTRKITLAPPLARALAPYSEACCRFLEKLKIFNTHYLAVIRPNKK